MCEGWLGSARAGASDAGDEPTLGFAVAVDIALRHRDACMSGELLDVPQAAASLGDQACCPRDEGPTARVRRASGKAELLEKKGKKIHDRARPHRPAPLRPDHWALAIASTAQPE